MIVNADDFGYSASVNEAVRICFSRNLINRTTVMVNMPEAENAYKIARDNGFLGSVGLHINLTEGKALSEECAKSSLCDKNGYFKGTFHVGYKARLYLNKSIKKAIYAEVEAQINKFFEMGFVLKHADSHNYTHSYFSVYSAIKKLLQKYGFTSLRISRNIPENSFSPAFKIYKSVFNYIIRRLKVNKKRINTTLYFGSYQDLDETGDINKYKHDIEIMTHPDIINGILTDNTLPTPHPFRDEKWLSENEIVLQDVSGNKKKIFIAFIQAHIGGAMTSLVNFVNAIDTQRYDVDLMFYENDGRYGIKDTVNILPQGMIHKKLGFSNVITKAFSPAYVVSKFKEIYARKILGNKHKAIQIMSIQGCKYSKGNTKEYDVAIAYELSWALNYVHQRINAKKKIVWHHMDYVNAGFDINIDKKAFRDFDGLVFVSKETGRIFADSYPEFKEKVLFMPNLLSSGYVLKKNNQEVSLPFENSKDKIKLLSVSRINYTEKGYDRALDVFERLKKEGLLKNVCWTIIGKGALLEDLKKRIEEKGLLSCVQAIGLRENPIPYMAKADALFLPSRNEGKPMVVTESLIMGLVPLVTEYSSSHEQIKDGFDGLIFENSENGIYEGLKRIFTNPNIIDCLKENVASKDYGNEKEISVFYDIMDSMI